jgi:prepilin-type N-terminal cleavage/methylation domain-containing protein
MRNERGFTLIEMMCAMLVLSLTLLIASALAQASAAQERRSALRLAISGEAVSAMENWRLQSAIVPQSMSRQLLVQHVTVTETSVVQPSSGLMQLTLSYAWVEGGRPFVQTWATLHP